MYSTMELSLITICIFNPTMLSMDSVGFAPVRYRIATLLMEYSFMHLSSVLNSMFNKAQSLENMFKADA